MKAMIISGFGGADRLELAEVPTPESEADEVLIRVTDAGVSRLENPRRHARGAFSPSFSADSRLDAAGTVAETGTAVTGFQVGNKVYAYSRKPIVQWGTYAEYVAVRHRPWRR